MSFQITDGIAVHIITHHRISHTVEFQIRFIVLGKLGICFLNTHGIQGINVFSANLMVTLKLLIHPDGYSLQHTTGGRDTDVLQLPAQLIFQFTFHFTDGFTNLIDIVNLSIQHRPGIMLSDTLCNHIEFLTHAISHSTYDASRSDVQTED